MHSGVRAFATKKKTAENCRWTTRRSNHRRNICFWFFLFWTKLCFIVSSTAIHSHSHTKMFEWTRDEKSKRDCVLCSLRWFYKNIIVYSSSIAHSRIRYECLFWTNWYETKCYLFSFAVYTVAHTGDWFHSNAHYTHNETNIFRLKIVSHFSWMFSLLSFSLELGLGLGNCISWFSLFTINSSSVCLSQSRTLFFLSLSLCIAIIIRSNRWRHKICLKIASDFEVSSSSHWWTTVLMTMQCKLCANCSATQSSTFNFFSTNFIRVFGLQFVYAFMKFYDTWTLNGHP